MSLRLSKQELLVLIAAVVIVSAVIFGGNYLFLNPKKTEISNKEQQLQTEEKLLATIEEKLAGTSAPSPQSVAELQKKVPVKQQLEQLILDLNQAEVISNSLISNMSFSEGDVAARTLEDAGAENTQETTDQTGEGTQNPQATQETTNESSEVTQNPQSTQETEATEGEEQYQPLPLPEGIKKLNVNLSVTSPSYKDLMDFLGALEGLNRRVVIESVAFSGSTELTNVEDKIQEFSYSITLSAFYMPTLEDLQDQLPELEVPAPGNKSNPFASSPDVIGESTSE
ncbi:hypothetical protein [Mesobacillus maritimus]|uniref:Pilus assembly protein PilO n=1 Tax=Mesobacillus maritimus TaxID=1643336 RepID=A0ABS7KA23_9BACI|nr:hypothetical protein [Mesobacillus maritimus]MBY0099123.1 hypothetical protein [Mesobacillus maritimus]